MKFKNMVDSGEKDLEVLNPVVKHLRRMVSQERWPRI